MIYFADSEQALKIPALGYENERAELYILQNKVVLNPNAPLIATMDLAGNFSFQPSSFFRYYAALKMQIPDVDDTIKVLPFIQLFKIQIKIKGNQIFETDYNLIAGSSNYDFESRYTNRFLTALPTTIEAYPNEPVIRYCYLNKIQNGISLAGTIYFDDGTTQTYLIPQFTSIENEQMFFINFGLESIQSVVSSAKTVKSFTALFVDNDNVFRLSSVMNIIIKKTPNYNPFTLCYRSSLGVFEYITLTQRTFKPDANKMKASLPNNEEQYIYSEVSDKIGVTTGTIRTSLAGTILKELAQTNEIYQLSGAKYIPLLIDTNSIPSVDLEAVNQVLNLEFTVAKNKMNYA
ncbi:hypothetical protein VB796_08605 [Arcicella sp. LKC2W]|uniref:hypothetical protein n=1 Tax=Arcicella sp. LKC2W TaxID=2984198 RepID=UPI002B1F29F4|nr:hypothetical protein [Arcicella sp. LKC2W]MEA5459094.1 hypothetical protein [Arcicella sp. LKC2W]